MLPQVLEAILDDDQDMQDMYLARRADMAQMIAPDPDVPADESTDPALALLPSVSSSSFAETALSQALQTVASTQEQLQEQLPGSRQHPGHTRGNQHQMDESLDLSQYPLEMAVPDQASLLLCRHAVDLFCLHSCLCTQCMPYVCCELGSTQGSIMLYTHEDLHADHSAMFVFSFTAPASYLPVTDHVGCIACHLVPLASLQEALHESLWVTHCLLL